MMNCGDDDGVEDCHFPPPKKEQQVRQLSQRIAGTKPTAIGLSLAMA